jgi:hypothetical protein
MGTDIKHHTKRSRHTPENLWGFLYYVEEAAFSIFVEIEGKGI